MAQHRHSAAVAEAHEIVLISLRESRVEEGSGAALCRSHVPQAAQGQAFVSLMRRAALYMRVSTLDQHPETQLYDLRQMAAQRGYQIVSEYTDTISGAKARRPGLDAMMRDARRGRFDLVLVWASDRIARSVKHFLDVLDELNRPNIDFVNFREQIDTGGPLARAVVVIIGAIAERCLMASPPLGQSERVAGIRSYFALGLATSADIFAERFEREMRARRLSRGIQAKVRTRALVDLMQGCFLRAKAGVSRKKPRPGTSPWPYSLQPPP